MKKFYLLILAIFIAGFSFGQSQQIKVGSSVGYSVNNSVMLKSAKSDIVLPQKNNVSSCMLSVAILGAPETLTWNDDVQTQLLSTGKFSTVDKYYYPSGIPSVATLQNYDAILTYSDGPGWPYLENLGDTIAKYIDNGGAVVNSVFQTASIALGGEFVTSGYELIISSYQQQTNTHASLGDIYDPSHPILKDVTTFNGSYRSKDATVTSGSVVVADWTDGEPFIVVKKNVGPAQVRRVDLNFFPPSSNARSDLWDVTTDGATLMANALVWASNKCVNCINDLTQDNDPGECGAVVHYDYPDSWAAATVTQIDGTGLSSDSIFPAGVTTQSYQLVWDGGSGEGERFVGTEKSATIVGPPPPPTDTCTFTVTVVDTEAPVVTYNDTVVYSSADECGAVIDLHNKIVFSEYFTHGEISPHAAAWSDFRSQLHADYNYTKLTMKGTFDTIGKVLTDPVKILQVANALRDGINNFYVKDGENIWTVHNIGYGVELTADSIVWNCNSHYVLRPDYIRSPSWGTIGTPSSCYAPSQTMTVEFETGYNNTTTTDNCGKTDSIVFSSGPFFPVGTTEVIATAYDAAGNTGVDTFTVTVIDTIPPTISIPSEITVSLNSLGQADAIVVNFIKALESLFVSDNCGGAEVTAVSGPASARSFTRLDVNQLFDLSVEATDDYGNSTTVQTKIKIVDDIAPVVKCNPITITLREDGRYALTKEDLATLAAGTTDNVDAFEDLTIEAFPKAFGCEDVSDQFQIDVYATDKAGNKSERCWVYCKVVDPNPLDITTVDDIDIDLAPGVCETKITYPEITSTSPCATIEQTAGLGSDGLFPLGTTTETWKATNTSGDTIEMSFNVTVTTTNAVPTLGTLSDVTVDEDSPVVNVPLAGISYGVDCIAQSVSVTALGVNTSLVTGIAVNYNSPDATGSLDLTIAPDMSGTDTIEVTVADDAGGTVSEIFVLTVNEVNDPPTLDQIANVTADEDAPVVNVPLTGISGGPDSESQDVSITALSSNPAVLSEMVVNYSSPDNTGSIDLTLAPDMNGIDSIRVTVVDSEGLSHSRTFVLTVNPVNDPPTVANKVDDYEVNASYEINVDLSDIFTDIDGDDLDVVVTKEDGNGLPSWVTLVGKTVGCTPMIADTGCVTLVITATDPSGATASDTFDVCVKGYPTAIDNLANPLDISMYPNPTKGMVTVEFNTTSIYDIDLAVLDITGKLILHKQYTADEQIKFNMSDQVSGMYFVKLKLDDKQFVKKLILNRK